MNKIKEIFPTFSFILRKFAGRTGKLILLLLIGIPLSTWCALRVSMVVAVWRANELLLRVKQLRARESTFEDAMRLADDYARHVYYRGEPCSSKNCSIDILLGPGWTEPPAFIYEIEFLRTVGIRSARFAGSVEVRDGHVVGTGFSVWAEAKKCAPGGQWLIVRTELTDHFSKSDYYFGHQSGLDEHPNRIVSKPHLTTPGGGQVLETAVTPDATSKEIERAFDFHLSCLSSLMGCVELRDLLPAAWEDYVAMQRSSQRTENVRDYGPCPVRSLARLARDMDNVFLLEVKRIYPIDRDQNWSQHVELHLLELLKGQPDKHLPRFPMDIRRDDAGSTLLSGGLPPKIFSPGKQIVMFLSNSEIGFVPYPHCEVVPATEENLKVVRQTIKQLAHEEPISALKKGDSIP